ncbi:MAG TPA: NAD-dependent epimerase/dehydratase family protein [Puia sp.]|jgi:nucleoside-diphosphate-sugar epimerase|nr:NAD-dependent epimerase/dehydratase family protein [Puia sp.]
MKKDTLLVIGACGQIGVELIAALRREYGDQRVIAADLKPSTAALQAEGPYEQLDVLNRGALSALISRHDVTQVYLLAALLSAMGEQHPEKTWHLNTQSLLNILDLARERRLGRVFFPSSIAVFGPDAPRRDCPQPTALTPTTVYGISKMAGESWCRYYWHKYGVDIRSIRYPGLISHRTQPGGGTTDYAVDIFHQALAHGNYCCYLRPDSVLPMMYMPDAIRATMQLMSVPSAWLTVRSSYNLAAMSFSPMELARAIEQYIPGFSIRFEPDYRQVIADSWPQSIDDSAARRDFNWEYEYGLSATVRDMLLHLPKKTGAQGHPLPRLQPDIFF